MTESRSRNGGDIRPKHRVVVWSTGGIGSIAIRAIHQRPNLDLVGVWVH
jgi:hypothetical protein